jgi:hypothetical protein
MQESERERKDGEDEGESNQHIGPRKPLVAVTQLSCSLAYTSELSFVEIEI